MIHLTLPLPPSVNHSHITTRSGKRIRSNETKAYMKNVRWEICTHTVPIGCPYQDKCYMDLWFYFPDNRRRDTHNCLKILLDSLQGIVYEDDKMVLPRIQDFQIDKKNPRVEIEIREKEVK